MANIRLLKPVQKTKISRGKNQHKRQAEWTAIAIRLRQIHPEHDQEILDFAQGFVFDDTTCVTIGDVVDQAKKVLTPSNVLAYVGATSIITGLIGSVFNTRVRNGELDNTDSSGRKGSTYSLNPTRLSSRPGVQSTSAPLALVSVKTPDPKKGSLDDRMDRLETKVDLLVEKLSNVIRL